MNQAETYQDRYKRAKARVQELRSFYHHLLVYLFVNACIAGFNYYLDQWQFAWFLFPLTGWGIGILGHAIGTFNLNPFLTKEWEDRKIKELVEKDRSNS